jgi:hypothetical protein
MTRHVVRVRVRVRVRVKVKVKVRVRARVRVGVEVRARVRVSTSMTRHVVSSILFRRPSCPLKRYMEPDTSMRKVSRLGLGPSCAAPKE